MNKRKILVLVIIIFAILASGTGTVILTNNKKGNELANVTGERKVLVEFSYSNAAWGFTYNGVVICENGEVYDFSFDKPSNVKYNNLDTISEDILNHKTVQRKSVSMEDLKKIKDLLITIEDDCTSNFVAMDAGQNTIKLYNYNDNKTIVLKSRGDVEINNNSNNAEELLYLLAKYNIKTNELYANARSET